VTIGDVVTTLRELTVNTPSAGAEVRDPISAIAYDSRRVTPGSVFVALKGLKADANTFVDQAVSRGAKAVVSESPRPEGVGVPWIVVRDARLALALLADRFFNHPSRRIPVVGVTGTNGKTTTSYLLASILDAAGLRAGMLGTVAYRIAGEDREAARTTPESPDVQQLLNEMLEHGSQSAVMEVSSHALSLKRVDGIRFAAGVFTNLTRDHLDFHEDMEAYFAAKRRLFEMLLAGAPGVINLDDPRGAPLVEISSNPVTYAIAAKADVTPGPIDMTLGGLRFDINTPRGVVHVKSKLVGRPNVYNILPLRSRLLRKRRRDGGGGLRAHRRRAAQSAGDRAAVDHAPAGDGVRLRRRSRSIEASVDGHGGGALERRGRDYVRQSALGRSQTHHRGNRARHSGRHAGVDPRAGGGVGRRPRRRHRPRDCHRDGG
jgi:UDP-N-acetylmuramoyl-L-alanyl-D-glutamate--2,6-diaminopimelate ligase